MKMSEAWPDTFIEGYIDQFPPEPIRQDILLWIWWYDGKSKEGETATWSEFQNGGKAVWEQILQCIDPPPAGWLGGGGG